MIKIAQIQSVKEWDKAKEIRKKVFQEEQGVSPGLDFDNKDRDSVQYIAFFENQPAGTFRLRPYDEKSVKIERLAVLPKMRRKGIALKLMEKGLEYCKNTSWEKILLHAQLTAVPLYEKLGFEKVGGIFEEAGIQHVKMIYHL